MECFDVRAQGFIFFIAQVCFLHEKVLLSEEFFKVSQRGHLIGIQQTFLILFIPMLFSDSLPTREAVNPSKIFKEPEADKKKSEPEKPQANGQNES